MLKHGDEVYVVLEPTPVLLSKAALEPSLDAVDIALRCVPPLDCTVAPLTPRSRASGTVTVPEDCGAERTPGIYDSFDPKLLKEWSPEPIKFMSFHSYLRKLQASARACAPLPRAPHPERRRATRAGRG